MWPGYSTGSAYLTDYLTLLDSLAEGDIDFAKVSKHRNKPLTMVDVNQVATEKEISQLDDRAGTRGTDRRAAFGGDIHAAMRTLRLAVKHPASTIATGTNPLYR